MSNDPVGNGMLASLNLFVEAVEAHENLDIIGEVINGSGDTILVVEDKSVAKDAEGHQITVELIEIFSAIKDERNAEHFVKVVAGEANPIQLNGITRIVGYYSRVNNWNKSKIGELRDRAKGKYWTKAHNPEFQDERMAVINNH